MTVHEAWAVVQAFEQEKARLYEWYRNTETGAEITRTVVDAVIEITSSVGSIFPILRGITKGLEDLPSQTKRGIQGINEQRHQPMFDELNRQIESLKRAIERV